MPIVPFVFLCLCIVLYIVAIAWCYWDSGKDR